MTRKECLDAAAACVLKDRQNQYGGPENNFERIAQMWNGYLGTSSIKPWDVAAMMGMLKMARARFNPKYADNWVDMAGYAACGIECATAQEEFDKTLDETQKQFLQYAQEALRACFLQTAAGIRLTRELEFGDPKFDQSFPALITPHNIEAMCEALNEAQYAISRNAYDKITFMQLSFKMSRYLRKAVGNANR